MELAASGLASLSWTGSLYQLLTHLLVSSPKTAHHANGEQREAPIDADLMVLIRAVPRGLDDAPVVPRVKSTITNVRKRILSAVKAAGEQMWPRCCNNLRASCEMDWSDVSGVSAYDSAGWIGHSVRIAEKHYVKARREKMVAVTGGEKSDAKSDAASIRATKQEAAVNAETHCFYSTNAT